MVTNGRGIPRRASRPEVGARPASRGGEPDRQGIRRSRGARFVLGSLETSSAQRKLDREPNDGLTPSPAPMT